MKRIMIVVAYEGTKYCGWQSQPNQITVEEVINRELSRLLGEKIEVIGASRTDSGVHAMGNVAVFDTETRIPPEKICYALNRSLPEDIVIQSSREVPLDFHPRHCDSYKTYEYKIWNADFIQPFNRKYTHFVYKNLNVEAMRQAAQDFLGTHCFTSFCSTHTQVQDHVRTIYSLDIIKEDHLITIRIRGNGFLYNMVRIIAGTLIKIGMNEMPENCIPSILEAENREAAGPTAPAQGLMLIGIEYPHLKER
ncbi:MAG: tRNA pseudouridine(38-40) synthase TruA [Lachnospiraceae bacterium]|nr:tRNA pseudouridine(38-40) synthase TruA [Lachnospiraceae bacterium]MBP3608732.1 tRNA pseudouridine(38-40) synthase TruA [Lachnospiraceae bacterium]